MARLWPIDPGLVTRISARQDRGEKHNGVDIYAPEGTSVVSPVDGEIIRVIDGRQEPEGSGKRRAGLWIDIEETGARRIHRLLHLGSAVVAGKAKVSAGQLVGTLSGPHPGGSAPHLHYEIRKWPAKGESYGDVVDPRPELSSVLEDKAYATIPGMVRAIGPKYDAAWLPVNNAITRSRATKDPDARLREARAALDGALVVAGKPGLGDTAVSAGKIGAFQFWGDVGYYVAHPKEGTAVTGKEGVRLAKEKAKEAAVFASGALGDVWKQLPIWGKALVIVIPVATVVSAVRGK